MNSKARLNALRQKLMQASKASLAARHLAHAILNESEPEWIGAHCLDDLPMYVEAEIAGMALAEVYADIKRHLDLCEDCGAEYVEELQLAMDEEAGAIPSASLIPQFDFSFLPQPSLPELVRQIAERMLQRLSPQRLPDLSLVADPFFKKVTALGAAFNVQRAYTPTLSGESAEALQVLVFAYFATQALREHEADLPPEPWEALATNTAQETAREMRLPAALADAFVRTYVAVARAWRDRIRPAE